MKLEKNNLKWKFDNTFSFACTVWMIGRGGDRMNFYNIIWCQVGCVFVVCTTFWHDLGAFCKHTKLFTLCKCSCRRHRYYYSKYQFIPIRSSSTTSCPSGTLCFTTHHTFRSGSTVHATSARCIFGRIMFISFIRETWHSLTAHF